MPQKKSKPLPLSASGWISVLTAIAVALALCLAVVIAVVPVAKSTSFSGRVVNTASALAAQMHESDYRGFWVPLFIFAIVGFVAMGAAGRARRRAGTVPFGRAVVNGIVDAIVGLAMQTIDLLTGGGSASRSSSSSSGGMAGGGGSFGGGGASGGW